MSNQDLEDLEDLLIVSINTEKAFYTIQHLLIIKTLSKLGIKLP